MNSILVLALAATGIGVVLRGSFRVASVTLLIGMTVFPELLPFPIGPGWLSISRVLLWAFTVSIFLRAWRGEIPVAWVRPTKVHVAFVAFLLVAAVNGIVLGTQPNPRFESFLSWLTFADQFFVFVAAVAIVRACGAWWVARVIAVMAAVLALIAFGERYLQVNWNHFFFEGVKVQLTAGSAHQAFRGGEIRVRGPSQFALEFGWLCALLVPVTLVVAARARHWVVRLLPGFVCFGVVWSVSRSGFVGIAVGAIVTTVAARDRRVAALTALGGLVAVWLVLTSSSFRDPFDKASPDSAESRTRRIAVITDAVADHPLTGLGLAAPRVLGVQGTDSSYVTIYAQIGALGIVMLGIVVVTGLLMSAASLRGPPSDERILGAAAVATVIASFVAAGSFDHFTIPGGTRLMWIMVAIGVVVAERTAVTRAPLPLPNLSLRVLVVLAAVGLGVFLRERAPEHYVWSAKFDTVGPLYTEKASVDPSFMARTLINSTCAVANTADLDRLKFDCLEPRQAPTIGQMRLEGFSLSRVKAGQAVIVSRVLEQFPTTTFYVTDDFLKGRPAWATTAPETLGVIGVFLAAFAPVARRRRARVDERDLVTV